MWNSKTVDFDPISSPSQLEQVIKDTESFIEAIRIDDLQSWADWFIEKTAKHITQQNILDAVNNYFKSVDEDQIDIEREGER